MRLFTCHSILIISATCILAITGCVRREEKIQIFEDGHIDWTVKMKGEENDIKKGDAIPVESKGWKITESIEKHEDKNEFIRTAFKSFKNSSNLPESFATDTKSINTSLQFTTSVNKEITTDGTYYHFKRVYKGRNNAKIKYYKKIFLESDEIKKLNDSDVDEISEDDKIKIIFAFIHFEHAKTQTFIEHAREKLPDIANQVEYLKIMSSVASIYRDPELAELAVKISKQNEDQTEAEETKEESEIFDIDKIEQELITKVESAITRVLIKSGKNNNDVNNFLSEYKTAREYNNITEDLGDEDWEVTVQLPGHILYHNSEKDLYSDLSLPDDKFIDTSSNPNNIKSNNCSWTFSSEALDNKDVVLLATSFVPDKN